MNNDPIVFVIQNQHVLNEERQILVPKYDFDKALRWGRVEFLLGPTMKPFDAFPVLQILEEKLRDFRDGDHLLLVGNPVFIGLAVAVAAAVNDGRVSMLQWSGRNKDYFSIPAEVPSLAPRG